MPRRQLQGVVTSAKTDKTIVVRVERRVKHRKYHKIVRMFKKYHAHDKDNSCTEGDVVNILEHSPFSKTKSWILLKKE